MSLSQVYADAIKEQLKYFSVWEPDQNLELTDYGYLGDNVFSQKGNLKDLNLGIEINIRTGTNESHQTLATTDNSIFEIGEGRDGTNQAKASLKIAFSKENACFFNAAGCILSSIAHKDAIGKALIKLYQNDDWNKDYVIVMDLLLAKSAQIVISKSSDSVFELEASSPEITKIDLADGTVKLKIKNDKNLAFQFFGENCGVLQSLWKIEKSLFSSPDLEVIKMIEKEKPKKVKLKDFELQQLDPKSHTNLMVSMA